MAVLWTDISPGLAPYLKATEDAARRLGVTIHRVKIRGSGDFDRAFASIVEERAEALFAFGDALTLSRNGHL